MKERTKYLFIFVAGFLVATFLVPTVAEAKTKFGFSKANTYSKWNVHVVDAVDEWVDDETGVHYLAVFDNQSLNALCPRYDSDGKIMVDKGEK